MTSIKALLSNKVFWGIVLTGVLGGLSAVQAIAPQYVWIGTVVAILTLVGHSTNVIKGVKQN
jgi:CHASE2 domain-containing sensor protein